MAKLFVNGSGSSGNSYILQCGGESLLIECGLRFSQVVGPLDNDLSSVVGCVISHPHCNDHCNKPTANKLHDYGVPMYGNQAVADVFGFVNVIQHKQRFALGSFSILPLKVNHGDCPNMAFVIDCADGRLVFATDLTDFRYNIGRCNFLCIEANYSAEMRTRAEANGMVWSQSENHMEIGTALNVIKRHVSDDLTNVVLIHLSDGLSDSDAFVKAVEGVCEDCDHPFVNVHAAKAGDVYEFNENPF